MKRTTLVLTALAMLYGCVGQATAGTITPGFDVLSTPTQTATIAGLGDVTEHGVPFGPGNTDTIIQRFNGLVDGQSGIINAQIIRLSVAGTILDGPFANDTFAVALDPSHASLGQLNVTNPTGPSGGTFTSFFDVFTDISIFNGASLVAVVPHEDQITSFGLTPWAETPVPGYPNDPTHPSGGFYITSAGVFFAGPLPLVVPAETPLPAALPLFATGLGGLGLLGWRRKRKA